MRRKNTWRETQVPLILDYADTEMIKLEEMFGTCTWKNLNIQNLIINYVRYTNVDVCIQYDTIKHSMYDCLRKPK